MKPTPEPLLIRITDAARTLSIGRSTVYALIAEGKLPAVRIGRSVRLRIEDVERLAESVSSSEALR